MIASDNLHRCEVFSSLSSYANLPVEKTADGYSEVVINKDMFLVTVAELNQ